MHDCLLSWHIQGLWTKLSLSSFGNDASCKCFPHKVNKTILLYKWMKSVAAKNVVS